MELFCDTVNATSSLENDANQLFLEPATDNSLSMDVSVTVCNDYWLPSDFNYKNESSVVHLVCKFDSLTTIVDIVSSSPTATMPCYPIQLPACLQHIPDYPLPPMSPDVPEQPTTAPPVTPRYSPLISFLTFQSPLTIESCASSASPISAFCENDEPAAKRRCVRRLF